MFPKRYWQDMTTTEFAALDADKVIAILPVGATEQHGPHLPVHVDACINQGIVERTLELAPDDLPITVLPAMPVGKSNEHISYPGTLTLGAETLTRLWTEIGESVARAGIRKLVLFNSHGGQPQIMDIVARDLRVRLGMFVVTLSWFGLGKPDGLFPDAELTHGIHGGSVETSMMLHLRPDLVQMDKAKNFIPSSVAMAEEYRHLTPEGRVGFGWQTQDLNMDGACGNALDSDAGRGETLVDYAANAFIELLREVERYPLSNIRERAN